MLPNVSGRMKLGAIWVMLSALLLPVICSLHDNEVALVNDRPIVGILSQELVTKHTEWKKYKSFISASYVKFAESAGAQVVPIWINKTRKYYEDVISHINGVLLPGGSTDFKARNGYADAGSYIYDIARELNKKDDYFPIWGTCQGMELLAYLGANRTDVLTDCSPGTVNMKLNFLTDYKISQLFGSAPSDVINILANEPVTPNFHRFCLTQENVTRLMGDINWRILSLNEDAHGLTFVSSLESRNFPFYGVQFHPEKNIFEWIPSQKTSHSRSAVRAAQYFADFFVNEARKNSHSFSTMEDEQKALIYNYSPLYVAKEKNAFNEQLYFFEH